MKGKLKYLIVLLGLLTINMNNVNAGNASAGVAEDNGENCSIKYGNECHKSYKIRITYNGKQIDGFCADYGAKLPGLKDVKGNNYNCTTVTDAVAAYILSADGYSNDEKTAALRVIERGLSASGGNVSKLVEEAKNAGGLILNKTAENNNIVTYTISSTNMSQESLSKITFTCGTGCSSVTREGNTVKVTVADGACTYEFMANYPGAGNGGGSVLRCTSSGLQTVYGKIENYDVTTTPEPSTGTSNNNFQRFTGELENTSSPHYQKYCDNGDKKNKCSDYTYVNIPTLCDKEDYSETNKVTIDEFPKDVQYCVLNGKDVLGNSFEMADNQISNDNPYCKVFCREEYEMNLPGAKFAESGRYFVMDNPVKVKAARSCYATGANGNSDEPQIDIEKFRDDVIAKQQEILEAKNDILKAKKELEQAEAAKEEDVSACGKPAGVYGKVESTSFTGYSTNINNFNQQTGVYKLTRETRTTEVYEWGIKAEEKQVPDYDNKGVKLSTTHCEPVNTSMPFLNQDQVKSQIKANLQSAIGRLNAAQNDLNKVLKWMQECYNWENKQCLEPTVEFHYKEPYDGQMNNEFSIIGGSASISPENPTYSSSKTLPNRNYDVTEGEDLKSYDYVTCGRDDNTDCFLGGESHTDKKISTLKEKMYYRKIVSKGTAEYETQQEWSTQIPHGTVVPEGKEGDVKRNYYYLGAVFPIALKTPYGVYKWTLDFEGIGQYNTSGCKLGRLDNVLSGDPSKLKVTGRDNASSNGGIGANLQYVCVYVVDCPDCDYECVGEYCEIPDCDDGECAVECVGNYCVYNGNGDTFTYRTVSLNDLNKAERTLGVNLSDSKGTTTVNKIIDTGEKAYENYEATFLMTAENMKSIRDYNKITGNYVSEDLTFEKNNDYINGKSEFLRSESINTSSGRFSWRDFFKSKDIKDVHAYWTDASADLTSITSPNTHVGPAWK